MLLRRLAFFFRKRRGGGKDPNAIVVYVCCGFCGEIVRVRADRRWDLAQEFDDTATGYVLHKDVLGTRCNRMMSVHITFDRAYAILRQEVEGGRLATIEEYEAAQAGRDRR